MSRNAEIKVMAELIMRIHDGKAYYNFGDVSRIIGCGINTVAHLLHNQGILVRKVGPSKRVSAYDIAEIMYSKRVPPID
jgi:beta-N-acetylglucosaminidase